MKPLMMRDHLTPKRCKVTRVVLERIRAPIPDPAFAMPYHKH